MAFSFRAGTNWCHDFPKLARESGFYFNMHGSRVRVDWNRISAIDIDRVICERDFLTIDENINNVIDYCLESEYDVKILDSNFVKLFRLAQLSVEYLLYCKQYLDHSVIILKDELKLKIEQNVGMKKEIATLEDTIKNLKEKSKDKYKLIETRVGDSNGEIYKCPHCPKTFVSAVFVNSHVARRHSYVPDMHMSISPMHEHYRAETEKLHNEIKTLKERLNQTERIIRNESDKLLDNTEDYVKNMSKNEYNIAKINRLEEQQKYQEDIGTLKSMLFDEIHALREKEHTVNKSILEANIKTLISQQEKEIETLRNQLLERLTPGIESMQLKLQTQENYWKTKMEDMETQHRKDIERLTTELKVTQLTADRIKSEYTSKVQDLEKQSMNQSNILVEQGKQLNCLSREINNSHIQSNNYKIRGKSVIEEFHESSLLNVKHDSANSYNDKETHHKNLSNDKNGEMIIEDIGSESSQEYSNKLLSITPHNKYTSNEKETVVTKDIRKFISDLDKTKRTAMKLNPKNTRRLQIVGNTEHKTKNYDILKDINETNRINKTFNTKDLENSSINLTKKYIDVGNIEKKRTFYEDDTKKTKKSEKSMKRYNMSSTSESESSSSLSQSESDSESVTADEDITEKSYKTSTINSPKTRIVSSMQEDAQIILDNRLRDLGIDPEWQGIPTATFKQKMEIIKHQQNINTKKFIQYNRIKQKILDDVLQRISMNQKELGYTIISKKSLLDKLVTHAKSKASKALSNRKDSDEHLSVQKAENTTSKLRLKQKIELLPKKYKDEVFEETCESPSRKNEADVYVSPKIMSTQLRLTTDYHKNANRDISSASSTEFPESVKQISSAKTIILDNNHKIHSPLSRKQMVAPKFSENNVSDDIVLQSEDSIISPKNNKSVLKPTSGSIGNLVKKKVFFDLEDEKDNMMVSENTRKKNEINDYDWNVPSFPEEKEYMLQKEKSMSTGNIVLKTSQSDKIAEISKKIQQQLNIVRKPPVGSVETFFRSNINLQDLTNYSTENPILNTTDLTSSILESSAQNFIKPKRKDSILPQPAPRTLKDKDLTIAQRENELSVVKYSDLDLDIDEILQME